MPKIHEGNLDSSGKRIAIVASRFNDFVTHRLVEGALDCLKRHGTDDDAIDVYWVPGSFEVPQMALKAGRDGKFDGVICVGTLIRGDTMHFDLLASSVVRSVDRLSTQLSIPVTFGLVTADSQEQAIDRAGAKHGNKGWQSALALIEMMNIWESKA
jgi:6,7-dimethyl-8-ribityllumazine synthase